MTPDKLPKEMQEQINNEADLYGFVVPYDGSNTFYIDDKVKGYQAGATAWAPWKVKCDELKHEIALLKEVNNESLKLTERCQNRYEALQAQAQRMADALDAFTNFFDKEIRLGYLQDKIPDYLKHRESLQQFKDGKGKDRPCPHCGKELSRDRNLCCRDCGKEVENEM